ncbi:MAG: hypothetical protein ACK2U3_16585 [Anaerolineales bacterium]
MGCSPDPAPQSSSPLVVARQPALLCPRLPECTRCRTPEEVAAPSPLPQVPSELLQLPPVPRLPLPLPVPLLAARMKQAPARKPL